MSVLHTGFQCLSFPFLKAEGNGWLPSWPPSPFSVFDSCQARQGPCTPFPGGAVPPVLKGRGWVPAKRMLSGQELGGREEEQSSLGAFSHSQPLPPEFPLSPFTLYFFLTHPSLIATWGRPALVDKG